MCDDSRKRDRNGIAANHTSLHDISAIVKPFNRQSLKVLEKAGFSYEGRRTLSDEEEYDTFAAARAIWIRPEKEEKGWKR
jgi:RimJ/RimL family protein N-acetyltransferase